jgi:hypothetical protein
MKYSSWLVVVLIVVTIIFANEYQWMVRTHFYRPFYQITPIMNLSMVMLPGVL